MDAFLYVFSGWGVADSFMFIGVVIILIIVKIAILVRAYRRHKKSPK